MAFSLIAIVVSGRSGAAAPGNGTMLLPGLPWPQALQGHDDENWPQALLDPAGNETTKLLERYGALGKMEPGIRRYNMFWNSFEPDEVPSSATLPLRCPAGTVLTPSTEADRTARGFHKFHCYQARQLAVFRTLFEQDHAIGAQNAAILYSAPAWARDPNCTGFIFGKDAIKGGCAPTEAHLDDFEDFVALLVSRFGRTLRHYVVWNEVASAGWMDMSPLVPNRAGPFGSNPLTPAQFDLWVGRYADLIRRTARALARSGLTDSAMIWLSTDRLWERHPQRAGEPLHTGTRPFLDRLWPMMAGDNITFGTAVHPYDSGNPMDGAEWQRHPQAYTFASIAHVSSYAAAQLRATKGIDPESPAGKPFTYLFASEQGWPFPACCDNEIRGRNICYAHALSAGVATMVGVTHNYFHDNAGGSEQGGQDYGLIAGNVSYDLANGPGCPTFDAYVSTSPAQWERSNDHFCCSKWQMGCRDKSAHGVLDPLEVTGGTVHLHGWAWDESAPGAGSSPVEVALGIVGEPRSQWVRAVANVSRPDIVNRGASGSAPDQNHGFIVAVPHDRAAALARAETRLAAFAVRPDGTEWQLASSPRCICGLTPCDCDR